jgi:hypothetical protein
LVTSTRISDDRTARERVVPTINVEVLNNERSLTGRCCHRVRLAIEAAVAQGSIEPVDSARGAIEACASKASPLSAA